MLKTWNQSYAAMMDAAKKPRVTAYLAFRCASEQVTSRSGTDVERYPMGQTRLKTIIYFPILQPMLIAALVFVFVLHQDFGILNIIMRAITGAPVHFPGDVNLALPTIETVQ